LDEHGLAEGLERGGCCCAAEACHEGQVPDGRGDDGFACLQRQVGERAEDAELRLAGLGTPAARCGADAPEDDVEVLDKDLEL
jgi:hypothetical protein